MAQAIEVASVKPSRDPRGDSNLDSTPGRLTATNITVRYLIRFAYDVKDYQIERAPAWVDGEQFDIAAKSSDASPVRSKSASSQESKTMVRAILEDRFRLSTHRETRQGNVYLLLLAKGGSKLTAHNEGAGSGTRGGCGHLTGSRLTLDVIATVLSRQVERDVVDRTGLAGKYDFKLDWTPDSGPCRDTQSGAAIDAAVHPSFYAALQEQLGLRLEPAKGPVETLIVDHVERPSGN
jgi:uncharacterized protein (TIGR03435 family)